VVNLEKEVLGTSGEIVSKWRIRHDHIFSCRVHSALDLNIFLLDEKLRFENNSRTKETETVG
jgi:hypothetical protein